MPNFNELTKIEQSNKINADFLKFFKEIKEEEKFDLNIIKKGIDSYEDCYKTNTENKEKCKFFCFILDKVFEKNESDIIIINYLIEKIFSIAIKENDIAVIEDLLENKYKSKINQLTKDNALVAVIKEANPNIKIIEKFIDAGANPCFTKKYSSRSRTNSPLAQALSFREKVIMELTKEKTRELTEDEKKEVNATVLALLKKSKNEKKSDDTDISRLENLSEAMTLINERSEDKPILLALLLAGANFSAFKDQQGQYKILNIVLEQEDKILEQITLEVLTKDKNNIVVINKALEIAVRRKNINIEFIEALLNIGADPYAITELSSEKCALDLILRLEDEQNKKIVLTIVRLFLKKSTAIEYRGINCKSVVLNIALQIAVGKKNPDIKIIEALLEAGANPFVPSIEHATSSLALIILWRNNEAMTRTIVLKLLEKTQSSENSINLIDRSKAINEALTTAIKEENPDIEIIKVLLKVGANYSLLEGQQILNIAINCVNIEVFLEMLEKIKKYSDNDISKKIINEALQIAVNKIIPNIDIITALLDAEADCFILEEQQILNIALYYNNERLFLRIIKKIKNDNGKDIPTEIINKILRVAVSVPSLNKDIINDLLDSGADPFVLSGEGLFKSALALVLIHKDKTLAHEIALKMLSGGHCINRSKELNETLQIIFSNKVFSRVDLDIVYALINAINEPYISNSELPCTTETKQINSYVPFSSELYANISSQFEIDNTEAQEQRKKDLQKIEQQKKENEKRITIGDKIFSGTTEEQLKSLMSFLNDREIKKLLALVNMDAMARNSHYEGFDRLKGATWSSNVIDFIVNHNSEFKFFTKNMEKYKNAISAVNSLKISAKEIQDISSTNSDAIGQYADKLKAELLQLPIGNSYCMTGGWIDSGTGHAMIYRFKKVQDGIFDIYIYNAQPGSEAEQGGERVEGRIKTKPCYYFKNVTYAELFFIDQNGETDKQKSGNSIILKRLIELLKYNPNPSDKSERSTANVLGLLSRFGEKLIATEKLPSLYLSVQRSGNCTFKSINCLLLEIMNDGRTEKADIKESTKDYKRLMLDVRFLSLMAFYDKYKDNFANPEYLQYGIMLERAARNYLEKLYWNRRREIITQEEYNNTFIACYNLLIELQKKENLARKEVVIDETVKHEIDLLVINGQNGERQNKIEQLIKPSVLPPQQDDASFNLSIELGNISSWEKLSEELDKLKSILDKVVTSSCQQSVISQFEITIGKLFSSLSTISNNTSTEEDNSQEVLCECFNMYIESVEKLDGYSSYRVQNTGMASLALSYLLAAQKDPEVFNKYGLYIKPFENIANSNTAIFSPQDEDVLKQRQELLNFYKTINEKNKDLLFDFENTIITNDIITDNKVPEFKLYENIINKQNGLEKPSNSILNQSEDHREKYKINLFLSIDNYPDDMKHIGYLKQTALAAFTLFSPGKIIYSNSNTIQLSFSNYNVEYNYSNRVWSTGSKDCISYQKLSEYDYSIDFKDKDNDQYAHEYTTINRENDVLVNAKQDEIDETDIAVSEPQVQTSLLIKLIEDNLLKLSDSQWRTKIEVLFFKTYQKNDVTISPVYEQVKFDDALIYKIDHLTDFCYQECIQKSPYDQKWKIMLFVISLRANLLFIKKRADSQLDASTKACNVTILNWFDKYEEEVVREIKKEDNSNEDKLNLEKKLSELRIVHSGLLLSIPSKELSTTQRVQLFNNMMEINSKEEIFSECESRVFLREYQHRFVICQNDWQDLRSNIDGKFCNDIIASYREVFSLPTPAGQWCFTNGLLQNEKWTIDLTRPMIMHEGKALRKTMYEITPTFKRLFGDQRFDVVQKGSDIIRFKDYNWGDVEIVGEHNDLKIYRYVKKENSEIYEKFLYIHPEDSAALKEDLKVNDALCWDHAFWVRVSIDQEEKIGSSELRIYDLHDGSNCLFKNENGALVDCKKKLVFYLPPENYSKALERFDNLEQIETWVSAEKKQLYRLEFPRYIQDSTAKSSLRFDFDDVRKVWMYTKDPQYQLSQKCFEPFANTNQRYLNLVKIDDENKCKVLIPVGRLLSEGFEQYSKIDTGEGDHDGNKLSQTYFEYEYDNKKMEIIPPNLEARIYLAHIYLAQKRYQEAKEVLRLISMRETPSQEAINLAKELLFSEISLCDQSPDACAIRLYVYYIFKKLNSRIEGLEGIYCKKDERTILDVYKDYLSDIEQIEQPLLLTETEELELLESSGIIDKGLEWRRTELQHKQDSKGNATVWGSKDAIMSSFDAIKFAQEYKLPYGKATNIVISNKDYQIFTNLYKELLQAKQLKLEAMIYQFVTENNSAFHNYINPDITQILLYVAGHQTDFTELELPDNSGEFTKWWKEKIKSAPEHNYLCDPEIELRTKIYLTSSEITKEDSSKSIVEILPKIDENQWTGKFFQTSSLNVDQAFAHWQTSFLTKPTLSCTSQQDDSIAKSKQVIVAAQSHKEVIMTEQQRYADDRKAAEAQEAAKGNLIKDMAAIFLKEIKTAFPILNTQETEIVEQEEEQQLLRLVLAHAGKLPTDITQYCEQLLFKEANRIPSVKLSKIMRAAATSLTALKSLNPNLSDDKIIEWRVACLNYMIQVTHRRQVNLIYKPLKKLVDATDVDNKLVTLQWENEVLEALNQGRAYNPYEIQQDYFPLMFEYFSGFRIKHNQANIIREILNAVINHNNTELVNKIFQLNMGGGKTSVIISIILEIVAQNEQLPIVLCHPSQYTSVCGNLYNFQESRYGKDLYALEYSLQELGDEKILDEIIKKIDNAKAGGNAIIMKSFMPQIIELKYILESKRLVDCDDRASQSKIWILLQKLAKINNKFIEHGVGVLDECDTILSMLTEVNVPIGDEKMLTPERYKLAQAIYQSLVANEEIKKIVKLNENKQNELSPEDYTAKVIPKIAEDLFSNEMLYLKNAEINYKNAFIRYVKGDITAEHQKLADNILYVLDTIVDQDAKENIAFLRYIATLNISNKQAADNIAIAAHIIKDVLPLALSRSCNRAYGLNPAKDDGSVIPYLGVGTPATTRFGYVYLALCYQLQTALYMGITEGGLYFLAEKMNDVAISFASRDKVTFDATEEAKWFLDHTGKKLQEVLKDKTLLKEACIYINKDSQRCLGVATEIAPFHIKCYQNRACSNPINFIEQMHKWVGCSGTPYNWHSYNSKLGELLPEEGAEGKVLNEMLRRAKTERYEGYKALHQITDGNLTEIIKRIKNHPKPEQLRCLIDAGGFLKDIDNNIKVATEILKTFAELAQPGKAPNIDTVIYLQRAKGDVLESFVLLKRTSEGEYISTNLKTTNQDEIKGYVKDLTKLFVFYDELRTTGTDITMAPGTIGLETVDPHMPIRTLLQATLRERGYFSQNLPQDVEFLITEEGRSKMQNQGLSLQDVVDTLISNQAIVTSDQVFSHYLASITNIVRNYVLKVMLNEQVQDNFKNLVSKYKNLFIASFSDEPYEQFGRIEGPQETLQILKRYAIKIISDFFTASNINFEKLDIEAILDSENTQLSTVDTNKSFMQNQKIADTVNMICKILKYAQEDIESKLLPKELIYRQGDRIDAEMQIDQEQMVEIEVALTQEQEQEIALQQELLQELALYNYPITAKPFKEEKWQLNSNGTFNIQRYLNIKKIKQVKNVCSMAYHNKDKLTNTERFANCFPDNLYMSENLHKSYDGIDLPLLHKKMKQASFVLVTKDVLGNLKFLLLSKHETADFVEWIHSANPANAWLMDLNGLEEVTNINHPITELTDNKESYSAIKIAIWYANFFNGDTAYLEKNKIFSQHIMIINKKTAMSDYVLMRSCCNTRLQQTALASDLLRPLDEVFNENTVLFTARREKLASSCKKVQIYNESTIAALDDDNEIFKLSHEQFKWLKKPTQIKILADLLLYKGTLADCLEYFEPEQIEYFDSVHIDILSDEQINELTNKNIIAKLSIKRLNEIKIEAPYPLVLSTITNEQISQLTNQILIAKLSGDKIQKLTLYDAINSLPETKIALLSDEQRVKLSGNTISNNEKLSKAVIETTLDIKFISILLDAGADPFASTNKGLIDFDCALTLALKQKDKAIALTIILKLLEKSKDNINSTNRTVAINKALEIAASEKNSDNKIIIEIINALLMAGADPLILISKALEQENKVMARAIMLMMLEEIQNSSKYPDKISIFNETLLKIINTGKPDIIIIINDLIRYGANPNIRNEKGHTPLIMAIIAKNTQVFTEISNNKETNCFITTRDGNTPLMLVRRFFEKNVPLIKKIEEDSRFDHNEKRGVLNQDTVSEKICIYLRSNRKDDAFIEKFISNYSNGIIYLYLYCCAIQDQGNPERILRKDYDWFINTIRLISTFNEKAPLTKKEKDCFEAFISSVEYFQQLGAHLKQGTDQDNILNDLQCTSLKEQNSYRTISLEGLKIYLKHCDSILEDKYIHVVANNHTTAFVKKNGYYSFFDPSDECGERVVTSTDELAQLLFKAHSCSSKNCNFKFTVHYFESKKSENIEQNKVAIKIKTNENFTKEQGNAEKLSPEQIIDGALLAAKNGDIETFKEFLGDKQDVRGQYGETAFFIAVRCKRLDIINMLLMKTNIDPNVTAGRGMTALMWAVKYANEAQNEADKKVFVEIVEAFQGNLKVDLNIRDNEGNTAFMLANNSNNKKIVAILINNPRVNTNSIKVDTTHKNIEVIDHGNILRKIREYLTECGDRELSVIYGFMDSTGYDIYLISINAKDEWPNFKERKEHELPVLVKKVDEIYIYGRKKDDTFGYMKLNFTDYNYIGFPKTGTGIQKITNKDVAIKYPEIYDQLYEQGCKVRSGCCHGISTVYLSAMGLQAQPNYKNALRDDYLWLKSTMEILINWDKDIPLRGFNNILIDNGDVRPQKIDKNTIVVQKNKNGLNFYWGEKGKKFLHEEDAKEIFDKIDKVKKENSDDKDLIRLVEIKCECFPLSEEKICNIEKLIGQIVFFQKTYLYFKIYGQANLDNVITKDYCGVNKIKVQKEYEIESDFSLQLLENLLKTEDLIQENKMISISSLTHGTALIKQNGYYCYFDPNYSYVYRKVATTKELAKMIFDANNFENNSVLFLKFEIFTFDKIKAKYPKQRIVLNNMYANQKSEYANFLDTNLDIDTLERERDIYIKSEYYEEADELDQILQNKYYRDNIISIISDLKLNCLDEFGALTVLKKELDANYTLRKFDFSGMDNLTPAFISYIEFICARNKMLDVFAEYTANGNCLLQESRLQYFMNACEKIIINHDEAVSATKTITNNSINILKLIKQDITKNPAFGKLIALNKANPTIFIALLKYGFTSNEGKNAQAKAELISKILAVVALFDQDNKQEDPCVKKILSIISLAIIPKIIFTQQYYDFKKLELELDKMTKEDENSDLITKLKKIIEPLASSDSRLLLKIE